MSDTISAFRKLLRRIAGLLLPPLLVLISLVLLGVQFRELGTQNEILSLSSFIVLLSFSALAFNWCRVTPSMSPEPILRAVYQAGVDLFLASLLALVAAFFAWLQTIASLGIPAVVLFIIHWLFLLLSVLLFLAATLSLVRAAKNVPSES